MTSLLILALRLFLGVMILMLIDFAYHDIKEEAHRVSTDNRPKGATALCNFLLHFLYSGTV